MASESTHKRSAVASENDPFSFLELTAEASAVFAGMTSVAGWSYLASYFRTFGVDPISRGRSVLVFLVLAAGGQCFAQDLCNLASQGRGFAPPPNADAYEVLDTIGKVVPFETRSIKLFPSSNILVKQRGGAAAQLCGQYANERWIFFDPTYIDSIKPNGGKGTSDLPRYFVLAHEAAHHINGDTLIGNNWTKDQELKADYQAAVWLTRLGVTRDQLLQTFDALARIIRECEEI